MSVKTEINRIKNAVTAIVNAIKGKGVTVPSGTKIDGLASLVSSIVTPVLQSKTVSPLTSAQTVKPDSGYNGLSQVTVNAIPTASCTVSGGGLSVTNNYSGTPTVDITLDGQTTSGVAITGTKPSSGYYLTLGASSSALSGTTKVTRNAVTQTQSAGYISAATTTPIASTTASPTVTVNKGTKTEYVTIPTATFSTSGKTVKSSTAGYVPANTNVGTVSDSYIIPSGTKTISSSGTHDVKAYASASVAAGSVSNPSITVNTNGVISASATKTAGYITAGTASNTKNAKDLDANLIASNIRKGKTIFGVPGSYEGSGGASIATCTVNISASISVDTSSFVVGATTFQDGKIYTFARSGNNYNISISNVVCGSTLFLSVGAMSSIYGWSGGYLSSWDSGSHVLYVPNTAGTYSAEIGMLDD